MSEIAKTCSCGPNEYRPTFSINYKEEKEYNCIHCGHSLSLFQVDCYDGSDAYQKRLAEIEEARERRKKLQQQQQQEEGEDIYDEVI